MEQHVFLRQVLTEMEKVDSLGNAVPFTIHYRTYNQNNKTGGRHIVYENVKLLIKPKAKKENKFIPEQHLFRQHRVRKNPNHWDNKTRNIETPAGMIKSIKILYITKFNGLEVVY